MKDKQKISEAEYEVMKVIWENFPISTNEIIEKFENKSEWSPKTIQTLISRLVKKGIITYKKQSRVYIYTPLISENEYINQESKSFLDKFYDGTINSMVLNFIEEDALSDEDIDELKKILDKSKKKGEK